MKGNALPRARMPFSLKMIVMGVVLLAVYILSFLIGSVSISVGEVVDILRAQIMPVDKCWTDALEQIMVGVRFPQITLSVLIGGAFLLLIDDIVRACVADLPLGVLTSLIGTPVFVFLLVRTRREWV